MATYLAKRKGMSFFRVTDKGKAIKDFSKKELRDKLRKAGFLLAAKTNEKSLLWARCTKLDLL